MISATFIEPQVKLDEGFTPYVIKDSLGFDTIGYGFMVDQRRGGGIDAVEADFILLHRLSLALAQAQSYPWFHQLDDSRQGLVHELVYQLGKGGFDQFADAKAALAVGNWQGAHDALLASKAAIETPVRFARYAQVALTGIWDTQQGVQT